VLPHGAGIWCRIDLADRHFPVRVDVAGAVGLSAIPGIGAAYTMAIEPFSSIPGRGLVTPRSNETHIARLSRRECDRRPKGCLLRIAQRISHINPDGTVVQRP